MQFGHKLVINPACQGHKFCVWRFTRISIPRFCLFSMFHSYCSPYALNQDSFCVWCRLQACLTLACLACGFPIVLPYWLPTQTNGLINWAVLLLLLINMWDGFIAQRLVSELVQISGGATHEPFMILTKSVKLSINQSKNLPKLKYLKLQWAHVSQ